MFQNTDNRKITEFFNIKRLADNYKSSQILFAFNGSKFITFCNSL